MPTNPPVSFEEKIDGTKALVIFGGLLVIIVASLGFSQPGEWTDRILGLPLVFLILLVIFGYPWFRERHALIRVETDGIAITDVTGTKRIPFSQMRSASIQTVRVARRGGYAYLWEGDFKKHLLNQLPRVNVLYRNPSLYLGPIGPKGRWVVLDIGADKLQAIPTLRPDELLAAIKPHLPV